MGKLITKENASNGGEAWDGDFDAVAAALEVRPQLDVVEDLAVEHRPDGLVLVVDRLVAALEVDDAQPRMAQAEAGLGVIAGAVRPARRQRRDHGLELAARHVAAAVEVQDSGQAAH